MKVGAKIKGLKSQMKILEGEFEALKVEVANKQRELGAKHLKITKLKEEIENFEKNSDVRVSEHAIIRYLERVKGFDISEIEREILSDEILKLISVLGGNGTYPNKDFKVLLKGNTVTTIIK